MKSQPFLFIFLILGYFLSMATTKDKVIENAQETKKNAEKDALFFHSLEIEQYFTGEKYMMSLENIRSKEMPALLSEQNVDDSNIKYTDFVWSDMVVEEIFFNIDEALRFFTNDEYSNDPSIEAVRKFLKIYPNFNVNKNLVHRKRGNKVLKAEINALGDTIYGSKLFLLQCLLENKIDTRLIIDGYPNRAMIILYSKLCSYRLDLSMTNAGNRDKVKEMQYAHLMFDLILCYGFNATNAEINKFFEKFDDSYNFLNQYFNIIMNNDDDEEEIADQKMAKLKDQFEAKRKAEMAARAQLDGDSDDDDNTSVIANSNVTVDNKAPTENKNSDENSKANKLFATLKSIYDSATQYFSLTAAEETDVLLPSDDEEEITNQTIRNKVEQIKKFLSNLYLLHPEEIAFRNRRQDIGCINFTRALQVATAEIKQRKEALYDQYDKASGLDAVFPKVCTNLIFSYAKENEINLEVFRQRLKEKKTVKFQYCKFSLTNPRRT